MNRPRIMLVAGEASGDILAAEWVRAFRALPAVAAGPFPPEFFGAGGPRMAEAGVEVKLDLTRHAVVGLWEVVKHYPQIRQLFHQLLQLARERQPDILVLVDYPGFNLRFARALQAYVRARPGPFHNWRPLLVYYVSPQLWAWHASRVHALARDVDLLLSIFPFEKDWYAARAPGLRVEFVGHPLTDRFGAPPRPAGVRPVAARPRVLLLPGSRERELKRHLPVLLAAARIMEDRRPSSWRMVLPAESLAAWVRPQVPPGLEVRAGDLAAALAEADLALASSGTVTMECAYFGVPTVVLYRTSFITYQIGRRLVKVKHIAMPNLLAGETVYPELIQAAATPDALAREGLELIENPARRTAVGAALDRVLASLGPPGASQRAAEAVYALAHRKKG